MCIQYTCIQKRTGRVVKMMTHHTINHIYYDQTKIESHNTCDLYISTVLVVK